MFDILDESLGFFGDRKTEYADVGSLVNTVANVFIVMAFGVSFIMFAYAIIQYITSTGDPKKLEKPQKALFWSFVGMIGSLAVFGIKSLIINLLDLDSSLFF